MNAITLAAEAAAAGSHTWEIVLALSTVALFFATTVGAVVTYKLAKATEADAAKLSNNSVDSMENIASLALTRDERIRAINHLSYQRPIPLRRHRHHA